MGTFFKFIKALLRKIPTDGRAFLGLWLLLFIFYPELFLVKMAPLTGDHFEQHYPWAQLLSESLKHFCLPFWTSAIQCGFPIIAESQIGAFYIPNLLMYFLMPFHAAYSYMNLVHWFIAGWGTYCYAKRMRIGTVGAFVAAVVFVFGAAYGGAYYNMTSLKTICWFPVALYLLENILVMRRWRDLMFLGFVIGQSLIAGYLQMAVLTWFIFLIYLLLRVFVFPPDSQPFQKKVWLAGALLVVACFAFLNALPQVYLTFQLAVQSNRTGLTEGYAYVGSMPPMVLGTLLSPNLSFVFRGKNLYEGSFPFFLMLFSLASPGIRKTSFFRLWCVMACLTFLLALGQWSPLYVAMIKITKFYSFRTPAKFLGFFCFSLAMLSAVSFQVLWDGKVAQTLIKKVFTVYLVVLGTVTGLLVTAGLLLTVGRDLVLKVGDFFVVHFIYAQPGHPHSLAIYREMLRAYPESIARFFSLADPANMLSIFITAVSCGFVWLLARKKTVSRSLLIAILFFIVLDLYAASYLDIKKDLASYQSALVPPRVLATLEHERAMGDLGRLYGFRPPTQILPLEPSQTMLYGIEDIGIYSPLVVARYYETIGLFGNINDSNFAMTPTPAYVCQRLSLLSALDVSHILSTEKLQAPELIPLADGKQYGTYLYKNIGKHCRGFFVSGPVQFKEWKSLKEVLMAPGFDPTKCLLLEDVEKMKLKEDFRTDVHAQAVRTVRERYEAGSESWRVETTGPGFFVLSNVLYPGWEAHLDGQKVPVLRAYGLFQAVFLPSAGVHRVELKYHPFRNLGRVE